MPDRGNYRRWKAPQQNGGKLVDPSWQQLPGLVQSNRDSLASSPTLIAGVPLPELALQARSELILVAKAYTEAYAPFHIDNESQAKQALPRIVMAGHQPELFHPGVWYKNFSLLRLAQLTNSVAINLIIDSDLCRQPAIKVPTGSVEQPRIELVPYDTAATEVPFEERMIVDTELFESFGDRAGKAISHLIVDPMVKRHWSSADFKQLSSETNLGLRLAKWRHLVELSLTNSRNGTTLELPQSKVCQFRVFRLFLIHLLANATEFAAAYNEALADYRLAHRLRNSVHPVPNLTTKGDWIETPFWIWTTALPERRPLYVQHTSAGITLSDLHDREYSLPCDLVNNREKVLDTLSQLEADGFKIRTRALATTMFARLFLCDAFVHGIGGAKYDEVSDRIIECFFGTAPPTYATVSATSHLPIEHPIIGKNVLSEIDRQARNLKYHPENFLGNLREDNPELFAVAKRLAKVKQKWIDTPQTHANAKTRHDSITEMNIAIYKMLGNDNFAIFEQREKVQQILKNNAILESREYSFCLFPEATLQALLLDESENCS